MTAEFSSFAEIKLCSENAMRGRTILPFNTSWLGGLVWTLWCSLMDGLEFILFLQRCRESSNMTFNRAAPSFGNQWPWRWYPLGYGQNMFAYDSWFLWCIAIRSIATNAQWDCWNLNNLEWTPGECMTLIVWALYALSCNQSYLSPTRLYRWSYTCTYMVLSIEQGLTLSSVLSGVILKLYVVTPAPSWIDNTYQYNDMQCIYQNLGLI